MHPYLGIRPVILRGYCYAEWRFALSEVLLNLRSLTICQIDVLCRPVHIIGDDDILAKPLYSNLHLIGVLPEAHLCFIKLQLIILGADVQVFTEPVVSLLYRLFIPPMG